MPRASKHNIDDIDIDNEPYVFKWHAHSARPTCSGEARSTATSQQAKGRRAQETNRQKGSQHVGKQSSGNRAGTKGTPTTVM